jgi:hypothetical protein
MQIMLIKFLSSLNLKDFWPERRGKRVYYKLSALKRIQKIHNVLRFIKYKLSALRHCTDRLLHFRGGPDKGRSSFLISNILNRMHGGGILK